MEFHRRLALFLLVILTGLSSGFAKVVFESGYNVTTIIDGDKLGISPHMVFQMPGSSDLMVLDSSSSVFYTISLPLSQNSIVTRFAGDGVAGFADGNSESARFGHPRNFAVDSRGNVYVADAKNRAIRKISNHVVTTIAGGISNSTGRADGPAQEASFSDDFELTFVPCFLLISDRGNRLVRQIRLKSEDCDQNQGASSLWYVILVVGAGFTFCVGYKCGHSIIITALVSTLMAIKRLVDRLRSRRAYYGSWMDRRIYAELATGVFERINVPNELGVRIMESASGISLIFCCLNAAIPTWRILRRFRQRNDARPASPIESGGNREMEAGLHNMGETSIDEEAASTIELGEIREVAQLGHRQRH